MAKAERIHRRIIRRRADYEALTSQEQEDRHRAFEVIAEMRREGVSLQAAARRVGTTSANVHRHAGELLVQERGRYVASPSDRSYQRLAVLSTEGLRDVDTRGSRVRSLVSDHWTAVNQFAASGDVAFLRPFIGKRVGGVELATDPDLVEEYARRGDLDIDDIYV